MGDNEKRTGAGGTRKYARSTFAKNMFVLRELVSKDFKLKYRRSVLGVAWSVLNPLLMMIVLSIVFSYLFSRNIENYPLYLILGNVTFTLMRDSTNQAMSSIIHAASLLKKVRVDRIIFPVQKVLFNLVNYGFSLIAVVIVMVYFRVVPTLHLLWLPVLVVFLCLFSIGLSLILASLAVFFRDIIHLWGVVLTAWTYLTPLFWDYQMLVEGGAPEVILAFVQLNPMYSYVTFMRDISLWQQDPSLFTLGSCIVWALLFLAIGVAVFRRTEHKFILYI